jgi:hypothetical protein
MGLKIIGLVQLVPTFFELKNSNLVLVCQDSLTLHLFNINLTVFSMIVYYSVELSA